MGRDPAGNRGKRDDEFTSAVVRFFPVLLNELEVPGAVRAASATRGEGHGEALAEAAADRGRGAGPAD